MADEFSVDLAKVEDVLRRLNDMLGQLDNCRIDVTYKTTIPVGYLGDREDRFTEAGVLRRAHEEAQQSITNIVTHLTNLIDAYGTKARAVHGTYQDAEAQTKSSMQ